MSFDRLISRVEKLKNPTVAGLDPRLEYIPGSIKNRHNVSCFEGAAEAIFEFNCGLIDALCDIVPAVKPQCAYYEMYGWQGVRTLQRTIEYAQSKGLFVITDGKRNDIGSTMEAYAAAHIGETPSLGAAFGADALTVNGYLGSDGIIPLLDACKKYDRAIFVLAKTSNKSSGELQDREIDGRPIYEIMGEMCEKWGSDSVGAYGYSAVGAVVGATYPAQLTALRALLPHTMFLVPGYGAQGGGAADIAGAFDANGRGAVINSSRAIMCAWQKDGAERDYAAAARAEAVWMRDDITAVIGYAPYR